MKRVAVIDLGSNSARLAIFERTSRLGFYLLREMKAKVRLGHGAYENGGVLQPEAIEEVIRVLSEFRRQIRIYKASRVLCGGTSALRDAPNKTEFLNRANKELGLKFRVISGKEEAFLGGLAALNLLDGVEDAVTLDIGGGSSELALIRNGRIIEQVSLNIGTVRLKELFFDKNDFKGAVKFIEKELKHIWFSQDKLLAIGGSLRAISNCIMKQQNYPLDILHNFAYDYKEHKTLIKQIASANASSLRDLGVKKERFDTIREGALIFHIIAKKLKIREVISSGVGVREGLFLENLLRPTHRLPREFSPSLRSLQDRFFKSPSGFAPRYANELFKLLSSKVGVNSEFVKPLLIAAKIYKIGESIGVNKESENTAFIIKKALVFGFSHQKRMLIAKIIENKGKRVNNGVLEGILPPAKVVHFLSFCFNLSKILSDVMAKFEFDGETLSVFMQRNEILRAELNKLDPPSQINIKLCESDNFTPKEIG